MEPTIDRLVQDFERGRLTRRELVTHVAVVATALAMSGAQLKAHAEESSTFKATSLNHIALNTPDIAVSRDFYAKHLGMTVSREGANNCFMTCGDNFVAFFKSQESSMNHYCYSVEDFDVKKAETRLHAEGLAPRREGNRIYFQDPHGLTVQLASGTHAP